MGIVKSQSIIEQFGLELATVIGALSETPTVTEPGEAWQDAGLRVTVVASDGGRGALHVFLDRAGAQRLAQQALASTDELSDAEVIEALTEMCGQAAASIVESHHLADTRLVVQSVEAVATLENLDGALFLELRQMETAVARVAVSGTLEIGISEPVSDSKPQSSSAPPLAVFAPAGLPAAPPSQQLELILDMELPLVVRFGATEMPLKALTELAPGAVIDLGRSPDDPVDVLVSNQIVARGEIVVVGGNYGVRITDVASPADRVRCMEVMA
jgi:flagellar motor switch protein FliN/FliY